MLRRPEPGTFEALVSTVAVPVAQMWRLSRCPATEPYYARNGQYRFDDPQGRMTPGSTTFGTLYVGQDPETAFCESVIHENSVFRGGAFEVSAETLRARVLVGYRHPEKSSLILADLAGARLKALGLNNDISCGDDYTMPQAWALGIHGTLHQVDGIRYVSRQCNDAYCCAVFDRSGLVADTAAPLPDDLLRMLCRRFNVRPISNR